MVKICYSCKEPKSIEDFYKSKSCCKKCCSIKNQSWTNKNKDKKKELNSKYRAENSEKIAKLKKDWKQYNKGLVNFSNSKRRAIKLKATPAWADLKAIEQFYINCPKGYEVDHIIPLQGKNVCGLHIEYNLQYLTPKENNRKNNKVG